jgi:hypothetical protein
MILKDCGVAVVNLPDVTRQGLLVSKRRTVCSPKIMKLHKAVISSSDDFAGVACWHELHADYVEAVLRFDAPGCTYALGKVPQHYLHGEAGSECITSHIVFCNIVLMQIQRADVEVV